MRLSCWYECVIEKTSAQWVEFIYSEFVSVLYVPGFQGDPRVVSLAGKTTLDMLVATTDRDSLRYTYNGTRRVRQLALGCESN